jgi:hypothetical protein
VMQPLVGFRLDGWAGNVEVGLSPVKFRMARYPPEIRFSGWKSLGGEGLKIRGPSKQSALRSNLACNQI